MNCIYKKVQFGVSRALSFVQKENDTPHGMRVNTYTTPSVLNNTTKRHSKPRHIHVSSSVNQHNRITSLFSLHYRSLARGSRYATPISQRVTRVNPDVLDSEVVLRSTLDHATSVAALVAEQDDDDGCTAGDDREDQPG